MALDLRNSPCADSDGPIEDIRIIELANHRLTQLSHLEK